MHTHVPEHSSLPARRTGQSALSLPAASTSPGRLNGERTPTGWQVLLGFGSGIALTIGLMASMATAADWPTVARLMGPAGGLVLAALSATSGSSRERTVRLALAAGLSGWLLMEIGQGAPPEVGNALTVAALAIVSVASALGLAAATAGRTSRRRQLRLLLDTITVLLTAATVTVLLLGPFGAASPAAMTSFTAAAVLFGVSAAILHVNATLLVTWRSCGGHLVMAGVMTVAVSLAARAVMGTGPGATDPAWPSFVDGAGAILVGLGAATWTGRADRSEPYARLSARMQRYLPLAAAGIAALGLFAADQVLIGSLVGLGHVVQKLVGAILLIIVVRQSLLLGEIERSEQNERSMSDVLRTTEDRFRGMVEQLPAVFYEAEIGDDGAWSYVSPQIERLLGYSAKEWSADPNLWYERVHPDDRARVSDEEEEGWQTEPGVVLSSDYRMARRDGAEIWVRDEAAIFHGPHGTPMWRGFIVDITAERHAEHALRAREEELRQILDTAGEAFISIDANDRIVEWNRQAERIFGWRREEVIGTALSARIIPPHKRGEHHRAVTRYEAEGRPSLVSSHAQREAVDRTGREFPVEVTVWTSGEAPNLRFNSLLSDITVRKQLEEQLQRQAFHDSLTGLANRALLADRLTHALDRLERRPESAVAILFLDIDDFKTVNDSLGHAAGDNLLIATAERIRGVLRPEDTAARLGGDEFALLLEDVTEEHARQVADRLLVVLHETVELHGHPVAPRASVGIAMGRGGGVPADELLRQADLAMYAAKGRGKARYVVFEPGLHHAVVERLELRASLEDAIEKGAFELHYQPLVNLRTGETAGLEALIRWQHPQRGLVRPGEFIPAAEESGLIVPIGRWVLEQACRDVRSWWPDDGGDGGPSLSVNLSVHQLQDPGLLSTVERVIQRGDGLPSRLVLEITESGLMQNFADSIRVLAGLKALGVRIAIDDFGTGYSSLSYLERLPIDQIKIDRSFIAGLGADRPIPPLTRSIIDMGRTLDLVVVAEGIEERGQLDRLRELGCPLGQGFLFSPAVPAADVPGLLHRRWIADEN